jgi:hypothetical protein
MITYDELKHEYRIDGMKVPSVTQVLKFADEIDDRWYTPGSAQLGTDLHTACTVIDKFILTVEYYSDNEDIHQRVKAWEKFKTDTKVQFLEIEKKYVSTIYLFAGTPDRICMLPHGKAIVDIKRGSSASWHGLQLNAYRLLVDPGIKILCTVRPRENGKYTIKTYPVSDRFLDLVNEYWRENQ